MDIILNSGKVINNVKALDSSKSPIGLFVWSANQARDTILSFDKITVRASQIAAIIEDENNNNNNFGITDKDLPFGM